MNYAEEAAYKKGLLTEKDTLHGNGCPCEICGMWQRKVIMDSEPMKHALAAADSALRLIQGTLRNRPDTEVICAYISEILKRMGT